MKSQITIIFSVLMLLAGGFSQFATAQDQSGEATTQEPSDSQSGEQPESQSGGQPDDQPADQAGEPGDDQTTSEQSGEQEQAQTADAQDTDAQDTDDQAQEPSDGQQTVDDQTAEQPQETTQSSGRRVRRLGDIDRSADEWTLDIPVNLNTPTEPEQVELNNTLADTALQQRLVAALTLLENEPDNATAASELEEIKLTIEQNINTSLDAGDTAAASRSVAVLAEIQPARPSVATATDRIAQIQSAGLLQQQFATAIAADQLVAPEDDNARAYLQAMIADGGSDDEAVLASQQELQGLLLQRATAASNEENFELAASWIDEAELVLGNAAITNQRSALQQQEDAYVSNLRTRAQQNIDSGNYAEAEAQLLEMIALGIDDAIIAQLRGSLTDARLYGGLEPGQVFRDSYAGGSLEGPIMMVLPAGSFLMGSSDDEEGYRSNESPRHQVTFDRGFALGQHEVTVAEFRAFILSSGYTTDAQRLNESNTYDEATGRMREARATWQDDYTGDDADDTYPVIHVSWNDANAYVQWLKSVTQRNYRLPSEAELEYAIRGGTQTIYWWGDNSPPDDDMENVTGVDDVSDSRRRWNDGFRNYGDGHWGPAPVASMVTNPFGLYDINGNMKEWTADCWHSNYNRAPEDGTAWVNPGCESRVVRGADWSSTPLLSRSATRLSARPETRGARVGIRIARDL